MMQLLLMAVLALLALGLLLRPWWSHGSARRLQRREANVTAYRTRLVELDNDIAAGLLDAESATALKQELAARLLQDADSADVAAPQTQGRRPALALGLVLLLPAFAAAWYFSGESWHTQQTIELVATHPDQAQTLMVQAMVQRLEQRLKKTPEDADGWAMLGRSYFVTQRYPEAAQAYAKASSLNGSQDAEWLVNEGEALAMAQQRQVTGEPALRFEQALKLEPNQGKALWYAGLAAAQAGQYEPALQRWLKLREQELPEELRAALDQRLQELSQLSGLKIPERSQQQAVAAGAVSLRVKVSLAAGLTGKIPAGASLFIFAKAASGPPMPLAVQKLSADKLPVEVTLDDSMAMMPSLRLSQFPRWLLIARISQSGNPQPQRGDWQGQLQLDRADSAQPVSLVISEQVK
jgi:cytochrome c-type biogenesis protein CcmH